MKSGIILFTFLFFSLVAMAQPERAFFDHLVKQDMGKAMSFFKPDVNLYIIGYDEIVSSSVAENKIREFLRKNSPKSYQLKHQGTSKAGQSSYYVCDLQTTTETFRLFVYFDKVGNASKISEFRIEYPG